MALNYRFQRHQVSLFTADDGSSHHNRGVRRKVDRCHAPRIAQSTKSREQPGLCITLKTVAK
jgi:hypothetical protein